MKKQLLFLSSVLAGGLAIAQTPIFSENFDGGSSLPTGWTQYNGDGLTVASNLSSYNFGSNAWVIAANSVTGSGNHAVSTSWYSPAGTSNDWLITPQIAIPSGAYYLLFDAMAPDANFPDGFKVYVSTTGNTAPADFGTAVMTVASTASTYTTYAVDMSSYAGSSVYIAIQNPSNDRFLLFVDNVRILVPAQNDAQLVSTNIIRYSETSVNNTLSATIKNNGSNPITSVVLNWNDGTAHSSTVSCNIAPFATATVNHPTAVSYSTVVEKSLAVSIDQVNGTTDPNMTNNTGTAPFNTISQVPAKNVVIEEGTGTWCGWCPRGAVAMEALDAAHPDHFIGIAVHNGDPMTVTAYDNGAGFSAFPGSNVDRVLLGGEVGETEFSQYYDDRIDVVEPAAVSGTANAAGSVVTINANATFYTNFANGNFRLGVVAVEDSVHGTTSSFDQHNYYSYEDANEPLNGAGHDWQSEEDVIPAANMWYNHVGRAVIGGYAGQTGSIPTAISDGGMGSYTFTYTVPSSSDIHKMHFVVLLIDQSNGEIINAAKLTPALGLNEATKTMDMNVFPNPATDAVNVSFTAEGGDYAITLTDLSGKLISTQSVNGASGTQSVKVDVNGLSAGSYLVTVAGKGASHTQHVVVK